MFKRTVTIELKDGFLDQVKSSLFPGMENAADWGAAVGWLSTWAIDSDERSNLEIVGQINGDLVGTFKPTADGFPTYEVTAEVQEDGNYLFYCHDWSNDDRLPAPVAGD